MMDRQQRHSGSGSLPLRLFCIVVLISASQSFTTPPTVSFFSRTTNINRLAASAIKNPFQQLPWNVRKEEQRQARRLEQERAILHRQLGIPEDASYEEIVAATDRLIALADGDVKQTIRIQVAKDKILQHRLNERLAGYRQANQDAKAQSMFESDGIDEDDIVQEKTASTSRFAWTNGLVVPPDRAHAIAQLRLWGIITSIGVALPPAQEYMQRFTWLVCVAQLTFRGMPKGMQDGGGMGPMGGGSGGGGHRKVAFALGMMTWIVSSVVAYSVLPKWARAQRWTNSVAFGIQNMLFGLVSAYLQPYKGG